MTLCDIDCARDSNSDSRFESDSVCDKNCDNDMSAKLVIKWIRSLNWILGTVFY